MNAAIVLKTAMPTKAKLNATVRACAPDGLSSPFIACPPSTRKFFYSPPVAAPQLNFS